MTQQDGPYGEPLHPGYDPMEMGYSEAPEPDAEGFVARAGSPREAGQDAPTEQALSDSLRTVYDPEIPVNIYDLGLIYETKFTENGRTDITMTLTAPGCPVAGILPQQVADAAGMVPGAGEVVIRLVWDPPWEPEMMSEDAKLALGFD